MKAFILITLISLVSLLLCCKYPCKEPERPYGIPQEAIWNGDCDGGYWLYLVDIKDGRYRFRIYVDYDSTVLMDADFVPSGKCVGLDMPKDRLILERVSVVEPEKILIKLIGTDDRFCSLNPIYPAYGGFTWEIIKKKGGYQ